MPRHRPERILAAIDLTRSRSLRTHATIGNMDSEEFVRGVKAACSDRLADGEITLLRNPPGRRPGRRLLRLSKWFQQLSPEDQSALAEALSNAAEVAIFGFFCVLDGVRSIESGPEKGSFELFYVNGDGETGDGLMSVQPGTNAVRYRTNSSRRLAPDDFRMR